MQPDNPGNRALTGNVAIDPEDWRRKPVGRELSCQTLYQRDGCAMTLLIADPVADEGDDEYPGIEDAFERYNRWNSRVPDPSRQIPVIIFEFPVQA